MYRTSISAKLIISIVKALSSIQMFFYLSCKVLNLLLTASDLKPILDDIIWLGFNCSDESCKT